ncbi:MAG: glutathione S-transferase family protein [Panacagrimonas sp.]
MLELYTFHISHFSEKARWMLDASRTEYREVCWTPFFHLLPALRHGRLGTTVPILRTASGYVQDSTRILHWLDLNMPGFKLLPKDPALRREVMDIEDRFDRIGTHVIRYAYSAILDEAASVVNLWTLDAGPWQKRFLATTFPVLRATFRKRFKVTPDAVVHSRRRIAEGLDFLDQRLADGRPFLVGDRLSAADITACALLAPLIGPDQHPVYSRTDFRAALRPLVEDWLEQPAAQWLRRMYRESRFVPHTAHSA